MMNALCILARYPNVTIIPVSKHLRTSPMIRIGSVAHYVPELSREEYNPRLRTAAACGGCEPNGCRGRCIMLLAFRSHLNLPKGTRCPRAARWFNDVKQSLILAETNRPPRRLLEGLRFANIWRSQSVNLVEKILIRSGGSIGI